MFYDVAAEPVQPDPLPDTRRQAAHSRGGEIRLHIYETAIRGYLVRTRKSGMQFTQLRKWVYNSAEVHKSSKANCQIL